MGRWFGFFLLLIAGACWWNGTHLPDGATHQVARATASEAETRAARDGWQVIAPGVELRALRLGDSGTRVVALRVKPERVRVVVGATLEASAWREQGGGVAAINGGYFDTSGRSLGLRVTRGSLRAPLRRADWGVFCVRQQGEKLVAEIAHTREFSLSPDVREAMQCGPRLVVNGRTTDLKPQSDRRSGVGITEDGHVVLAICDGALPFARWAALWQTRDGFNCRDALNLDGGGSTQLSLRAPRRNLDVPGNWPVPDAIVVK